jgi:hypothetical protein
MITKETRRYKNKKRKLSDIFDFTKTSDGQEKNEKYETFFEAVACIVL